MVKTIGFTPSSTVPANTLLRLTFGEPFSLNPDALFARYMADVFNKLGAVAHVIPIAPLAVAPGAIVAVVDAMNHNARPGAEILSQLDSLGGNFVEIRSVELLTPEKKANATKPAGAAERDAQVDSATAAAQADSVVTKFFHGLGVTASVLKWVAIALVVLAAWYYLPRSRQS